MDVSATKRNPVNGLKPFIVLIVAFLFIFPALCARADTNVSGVTISVDTTWTVASSSYIVNNYSTFTVAPTATLTIAEGVRVRLGNFSRFDVKGKLNVIGKSGNPVVFTALDTGPFSGSAWYLQFLPGSGPHVLSYLSHEYGRAPIFFYSTTAVLDHITTTNVESGISSQYSNISIINSNMSFKNTGITDEGSSYTIDNSAFQSSAIYLSSLFSFYNSNVDIKNSTLHIPGNYYGSSIPILLGDSNAQIFNTEITKGNSYSTSQDAGIYVYSSLDTSKSLSLSSTTVKYFYSGSGVQIEGGGVNVNIEKSLISKNGTGIKVSGSSSGVPTVNIVNSRIAGNFFGINDTSSNRVNAISNWWGDPSGPTHLSNPSGVGDKVSDGVDFFPWLSSDPSEGGITKPVIIIPGVAGSELMNGDSLTWLDLNRMFIDIGDQFIIEGLALDDDGNSLQSDVHAVNVLKEIRLKIPLLGIDRQVVNIFKGLNDRLSDAGYVTEQTLFFFPYDWRLNLDDTMYLLNDKINEIKKLTGSNKVDIITHSMGGLLAKDYLQRFGHDSVGKLIFIGTPHLGAPKAGKILIDGDNFGIPWLDSDRVKEIALNSPAVYELLPSVQYFIENGGYIKPFNLSSSNTFFNNSETNDYLEEKGASANIFAIAGGFFDNNLDRTSLYDVEAYNIAGCKLDTQAKYYLDILGVIGKIDYLTGDGTVPLTSANYVNIPDANKYYAKKTPHMSLPSTEDVKNAIINILSDKTVVTTDSFSFDSSFCNFKGKMLVWHSPVDVHIYDSENRHSGPIENNGMENNIPGVDYEIVGHNKFIFLPTDTAESYRIEAQGTDIGTFDLQISQNENGEITSTNVFNDVPIDTLTHVVLQVSDTSSDSGITLVDTRGETKIVPVSASLTGNQADDFVPPDTAINLSGMSGLNGWYTDNILITLSANDDNSGVLETLYSLDGGISYAKYASPILISDEGIRLFKYYSVDRAGNDEVEKSLLVKIDRTSPEALIFFDISTKAFQFQAENEDSISCTLNSCSINDDAGNLTRIQFTKSKSGANYILNLQSITYNDVSQLFPDNSLVIIYDDKNGVIKKYIQSWTIDKQELLRIEYNHPKDESSIYINGVKQTEEGKKILNVISDMGILKINIE